MPRTRLRPDEDVRLDQGIPQEPTGRQGSGWTWFWAAFSVVVLVGVSILYLASRPDPVGTPVAVAPEPQDEAAPADDEAPSSEAPSSPVVADDPEPATGAVIEVEMFEFGYSPETIEVAAGVPTILRFTNSGRLPHEAMVGDGHMQEEFASAGNHDDGAGDDHHGDLMAVMVDPGETAELEVLIEEPGTWYFACHLVGHYEQGQVATINVTG